MYLDDLFEQRQTHSEISYRDKKVKGILDRVVAVLSGNKSGQFTRIAQRYRRINRLAKLIKKERDDLNQTVKDKIKDLFNAEDEILTRVIETASLTITLSKEQTTTETYFDIEGYVEELEKLIPGLETQLKKLRKKYTTVDTFTKSAALRVKLKDKGEEEITESLPDAINDLLGRVKNWANKVLQSVEQWLISFDAKLDDLERRVREKQLS